jgi:hypothetical protein
MERGQGSRVFKLKRPVSLGRDDPGRSRKPGPDRGRLDRMSLERHQLLYQGVAVFQQRTRSIFATLIAGCNFVNTPCAISAM